MKQETRTKGGPVQGNRAAVVQRRATGGRAQLRQDAGRAGSYAAGQAALSAGDSGGSAVQMSSPPARDLDYNTTRDAKTGENRNPDQVDGLIPFVSRGVWNASVVLSELTQVDDDPLTTTDNIRCAAASVLGVHIQGGPLSVMKVALHTHMTMISQRALSVINGLPEAAKQNFKALTSVISGIPGRIEKQSVTYQDLRRLAHCMKYVVDWDPNSGTNPGEYKDLTDIGFGMNTYIGKTFKGWSMAKRLTQLLRLVPSVACILSVSTRNVENGSTNHAVTFGYDGDVYLYDPWPRAGSQIMHMGSNLADIKEYFEHPDGTERTWRVREVMSAA